MTSIEHPTPWQTGQQSPGGTEVILQERSGHTRLMHDTFPLYTMNNFHWVITNWKSSTHCAVAIETRVRRMHKFRKITINYLSQLTRCATRLEKWFNRNNRDQTWAVTATVSSRCYSRVCTDRAVNMVTHNFSSLDQRINNQAIQWHSASEMPPELTLHSQTWQEFSAEANWSPSS